jgi:zinc protease
VLGLEDNERHAAQALLLMLPRVGLGGLDDAAVRELTGARRARVDAGSFPGRFYLRGRTDQDTLAFQLEWLCALCAQPGDDWAALTRTLQAFALRDVPAAESSEGQVFRFFGRVTGQAMHFERDQLLAIDAAAVRTLVKHHWLDAPITVVVVGDFAPAMTLDAVARTFGRLPARPAADENTGADPIVTVEEAVHHEADIGAAEPSSLIGVLASLSADEGAGAVLPVRVLTRVLTDRLMRKVREQMGATYAAQVIGMSLGTRSRCSVLWIQARTAPGQEAAALAATLAQIEQLRDAGITAAELDAVRQQLRNELRERSPTNGYWLFELSVAHGRPTALAELAQEAAKLDAVTRDDVREAARRCLAAARLSTLVVAAKPAK